MCLLCYAIVKQMLEYLEFVWEILTAECWVLPIIYLVGRFAAVTYLANTWYQFELVGYSVDSTYTNVQCSVFIHALIQRIIWILYLRIYGSGSNVKFIWYYSAQFVKMEIRHTHFNLSAVDTKCRKLFCQNVFRQLLQTADKFNFAKLQICRNNSQMYQKIEIIIYFNYITFDI